MSLNLAKSGFSITLWLVMILRMPALRSEALSVSTRGGVIEIGGDAAGHREGGVGDAAGDRGRQQDADDLFVGVEHVAQKQAAENDRPHQELSAVELHAARVGDLPAEERLAAIADHRAGQGDGALLAAGDGVGAEVLHGLADGEDVGRIVDRFAEPDRDVARPGAGPLPEEASAAEAEDAAPQLVEENGDDRRAGVALDFEDAGLEGLQLAGAGDAAFGKDADELAVLERGAGGFDGVAWRPWACCGSGCRRRSCRCRGSTSW